MYVRIVTKLITQHALTSFLYISAIEYAISTLLFKYRLDTHNLFVSVT
jgi:hypothetical protein